VDHAVLSAIVGELQAVLANQPAGDIAQLDTHRFLVRFEEPPFPRLHVVIHPAWSSLHLARGLKAPAAPTELASVMSSALEGRRVVSVDQPPGERVVRLDFEGGTTLVAELMGKASNLLLLDGAGRIVRFARSHAGEFRQPREGAPYTPPPPSSAWRAPEAGSLNESDLRAVVAGAQGKDLASVLSGAVPGFSVLLAREVAWLVSRGEDAWRAFLQVRARGGERDPVVYAPAALEELSEAVPLNGRRFFACPFRLGHADAAGLVATPFGTVNEAEAAAGDAMAKHMAFAALQGSLGSLLRQEARRSRELAASLQRELDEAQESGTRDRRRGELILAGLRSARKEGDRVRVPDVYDPEGKVVEIPIDARLDLRANAERFFQAARRADRAVQVIPARLRAARARSERVAWALERLQGAPTRDALERLERLLQDDGIVKAFRREPRAGAAKPEAYVPVRSFTSRDGFTILVGKTAADNDHLTFHVAAPHDLWLHAAGYPGAHVIVRNPKRLPEVPHATVLEAAGLAAYLSQGKEERELDVHVAWRRHVRKARGMSPGMVMLKRHRTVRVAPAMPRPAPPN
jgi:predicted ribosome quality control (RQC) complex YloA/Tae2 family protein